LGEGPTCRGRNSAGIKQIRLCERAGKGFQVDGLLDGERSDFCAAQRVEHAAAAERLTEITRKGSDVGSLAARHIDREEGERVVGDGDGVNEHRACREFGRITTAGKVIAALAIHPDSRVNRWSLHDGAGEGGEHAIDLLTRRGTEKVQLGDVALTVIGGRGTCQIDDGEVTLSADHDAVAQSRRLADEHDHEAGGEWIERAAVADLDALGAPAATSLRRMARQTVIEVRSSGLSTRSKPEGEMGCGVVMEGSH
jgi:hypothetical protein